MNASLQLFLYRIIFDKHAGGENISDTLSLIALNILEHELCLVTTGLLLSSGWCHFDNSRMSAVHFLSLEMIKKGDHTKVIKILSRT